FPSEFILEQGDFIVLHIDQAGEDEIIDENENGYIDLYSNDSGLTGTDNVITIEDREGNIVDAPCFSNIDETWSMAQQNAFNSSVESNQWTGTIDGGVSNEAECVDWSGGSDGYSVGRDEISTDTDNEGEARNDWIMREYQTRGFANRENLEPEIESLEADPDSFILGEEDLILFTADIYDEDGLEDIASVNIDLSELGGEIQEMHDDGANGDEVALDGTYSYEYILLEDISFGNYLISITATDSIENETEDSIEIEIIEPTYSDRILINEILPNPEGSDSEGEFIELYNESSEDVDLENWQIGDSSSTYTISSDDFTSTIIIAHSYFTIYRDVSGISLNNTGGETINLYQPNENLLDTATYSESAVEGQSYNLLGSAWEWSIEITPGNENQIVHENHDPEAQAGSDIEVEIDEKITFDGSGSSDVDEDTLSYEWDFDDGDHGAGSKTNHSYSKKGSYTVELTVSDGREGEDSDTLKVKVTEPDIESDTTINSNSNSSTDSNSDSEEEISGPFSKDIIITEVLPNPEGSDTVDEGEFIEIYNKGDKDVNLESWQIDDEDGGSSPHTIENKVIKAGEYLVFYRGETKLSLNNSDEKARLIHPDGNVVSETYYEDKAEDGFSYALDSDDGWQWTDTPTPGEANTISGVDEEGDADGGDDSSENEESDTVSKTSDSSKEEDDKKADSENSNIISITEAKEKQKNSEVKVKGIVISEPGLFSKKTFYIQDATSGIQIYFSKEDFPKLELGDEVTATGKRSESGNEKKINISAKEDIQVLGHKAPPQPKEIKTGDLKENYEGQLVKIAGEIAKTSGNVFYLDDGSGQAKVYINKNTNIQKPEIKKGNSITILGIGSETSSGYRVLPRYQSDIRDGDGGILAGITNKISGNIPQAGGNVLILLIFAFVCTVYFLLPKWIYVWRVR
ncbi:MAG: lamin tail domain-containing protein, partial [Parcubacteria group bacterium]|nr:lamin tail domain-containing protein [Parcubacteria group bacterium]